MTEAQRAETPRPESFMTLSEFNEIVGNNVAGVFFDIKTEPGGNLQRLHDRVKNDFNPYEPKTWDLPDQEVRRYQIILNPDQTFGGCALSFVRQVNNIHFEVKKDSDTYAFTFWDEIKRRKLAEIRILEFYANNADFIKQTLKALDQDNILPS